MSKPDWKEVKQYEDITYHKCDGVARIAFNRPEVRNAFRPDTLLEMQEAFRDAGEDPEIGVVLMTGNGPSKDGKWAFCAGGDQKVRGEAGYVGKSGVPRLNVLELQRYMRSMPKPVIALVAGYAIGGWPQTTRFSARQDRWSDRSTGASAPRISRAWWARNEPERSGISATIIRRRRRTRWAW